MAANVNQRPNEPSCPLVQGPYRHYVLNLLWIFINVVCIMLTIYHLVKLYKDYSTTNADTVRVAALVTSLTTTDSEDNESSNENLVLKDSVPDGLNELRVLTTDPIRIKMYLNKMEREGIDRVKMFLVITVAYLIFWGPLYLVTILNWNWSFEEAKQSVAHEVTLHVAFVHSFVNPSLLLVLHKGIRQVNYLQINLKYFFIFIDNF